MRRWLALAVTLTLAACGQPQAKSPIPTGTHSATARPVAATPTASGVPPASDSYPSAPTPQFPYVGNGVYGNALLVGESNTWYWDGTAWHHSNAHMPEFPHTPPVFDPVLHKSVMLTNGDTGQPVDTWVWSGSSWSNLSASPPGETGPSLLGFDAATQQLIALVNATWRFDGTGWQHAGGQDSPQIRYGTGLVYDPRTSQLILFGGLLYQGQTSMADTWTWDGQGWTLRHPATQPPAGWASLAYDPDTTQLLMVDQEMADQSRPPVSLTMWSWNGADWQQLHPAALPPLGNKPTMAYDLANHQLIYFFDTMQTAPGIGGSQTWVYTNGSWKRAG
jgi:hypothetical protein